MAKKRKGKGRKAVYRTNKRVSNKTTNSTARTKQNANAGTKSRTSQTTQNKANNTSKIGSNKPKLSKEKESVIHKLLRALGLVKDKKQKKEQKYTDYNVGQIRPVNTKETKGHNGYVITKKGIGKNAEYGYVSLTHSNITDGQRNVKLLQNPNPNDTKDSYAVNKAKVAKASDLGKQKNGWKLNKRDKRTLKNIFHKNKKK